MRRPVFAATVMLTCFGIVVATPAEVCSGSADDGDRQRTAPATDIFGLTRVVNLHIEMAAGEYQAIQPLPPAGGPGAPPAAPRPKQPGERPASGTSLASSFPGCAGRCLRKARRTKASASATRETPHTWPRPGA